MKVQGWEVGFGGLRGARGGVAGGWEKGDAGAELGRTPKVGRLGGEGEVTWQDVQWGHVCVPFATAAPERGPSPPTLGLR